MHPPPKLGRRRGRRWLAVVFAAVLAGSLLTPASPSSAEPVQSGLYNEDGTQKQTPTPTTKFYVDNAVANEGETAVVDVFLASPAPSGGVSFTVSDDVPGTTAGSLVDADISGTRPTSLTIPVGQTVGKLRYDIVADSLAEPKERMTVTVTAATSGWSPLRPGADSAFVIVPANEAGSGDLSSLPETLWSATLTVPTGYGAGCDNQHSTAAQKCTNALSEDEFTLNGATRAVIAFARRASHTDAPGPVIRLRTPGGAPSALKHYVLHVDGKALPFLFQETVNPKRAYWDARGVSWSAGDTVELSLKRPLAVTPLNVAPPQYGVVLGGDDLISDGAGGYSMAVDEGQISVSFTVALSADPGRSVPVIVRRAGYEVGYDQLRVGAVDHRWNTNAITLTSGTMTFSSSNYSTPQTVTFTVAEDPEDATPEQLVILIVEYTGDGSTDEWTAVGGASNSITGIHVTVTDDDAQASGAGSRTAEASPYAALITKMYGYRNDPQWKSYKAHTDRWDRALLALGENVADTSLTAMRSDEAQGYADQGWTRWTEVATALQAIETARPYAALITKMYRYRDDPQWKSYKAHTDRWDRALLALGAYVADQSLTVMTAAEARGYADQGWTRWTEVATALAAIEGG